VYHLHRENAKEVLAAVIWEGDDELRQYVLGTYYSTGVCPPLKSKIERRGNKH
jgi:hypothetical protein